MSPIFIKHFNKAASVGGSIAKQLGRLPGWGQAALGIGGAAALSEGEHHILDAAGLTSKEPGTNNLQRLVTHGLNLTMLGLPYGSKRLRQDSFAFKNPMTGLPIPGSFDTSKGLGGFSKKILAAPALSAGINLATATGDVKGMTQTGKEDLKKNTEMLSGLIKDVKGQIAGLAENVTGLKPGETPADASARRVIQGIIEGNRSPADDVVKYKVPPSSGNQEIAKGVEKAFANMIAKHPDQAAALATKRDQYLGEWQALAEHDMNSKDIWKTISGIGETVGNLKQVSVDAGAGLERALAKSDEFSDLGREALGKVDKITDLSQKGMTKIDQGVGNLTRNLGFAAAGAGALWGGYNLLRDYLNYNRIKKEREAKMQASRPKLAGVGGFLAKKVLPAAGLGAFEGMVNYELDPEHPALAALAGTLGAASGANLFRGGRKLPGGGTSPYKFNPKGIQTAAGAAILPRALAYLQSGAKENLAQASSHGATPANIALGVGGGALTVAALAALYQGARAAKQVAEGQPLVNATTSNTILSGSGGPENPNFGGKMLVTLPTRNPGDRETTIELPLENVPLSDTLINKIRRDTKRRLRTESDTRTLRDDDRSPERMKQLMAVN